MVPGMQRTVLNASGSRAASRTVFGRVALSDGCLRCTEFTTGLCPVQAPGYRADRLVPF